MVRGRPHLWRGAIPLLAVVGLVASVLLAVCFFPGGAVAETSLDDDDTPPQISEVKATPTATGATITWTTNEPATSQVEYLTYLYSSSTTEDPAMVTSHSVGLTGLSPRTTYYYTVKSTDASGNLAESKRYPLRTLALDTTAPVISKVTAISITATGATITWTTNEAATSQVEYGLTTDYGTSATENAILVSRHSVGLTGLSPQTVYHYRVKSQDASNNETISADYRFTTAATPAPVISKVAATATATGATITWTTKEVATSQVEYGLTYLYGSSTTEDPAMVTSHSVALTGLSPQTVYHYRVKSQDASGNPAQSADYHFTTADDSAPVISNVAAINVTAMSVTFTWTTDEPATSQVEYGTSASYGSTTSHDLTLVTDHSVGLTGLRSQTTYHYIVKSRNATGFWAASGDHTFTTPDVAPPAISGLYSTDITATSATIIWTTSENATSLVVYGTSASYGSTTSHDMTLVRSHSVGLTGLSPRTTYHCKVKSSDAAGLWAESEDYAFTTTDIGAPVISEVTAINITANGATITWTTDDAAESQVEYGTKATYGSITTLDANRVNSHRVDLVDLSPGTTYHYKVKSRDASGLWAWSADYTFTTDGDPPATSGTTPASITGEVSSFRLPTWAWAAIGIVVALALGAMIVRDI